MLINLQGLTSPFFQDFCGNIVLSPPLSKSLHMPPVQLQQKSMWGLAKQLPYKPLQICHPAYYPDTWSWVSLTTLWGQIKGNYAIVLRPQLLQMHKQYRWDAPGMETLPIRLGRPVHRERKEAHNCFQIHCKPESLLLVAFLVWNTWGTQCPQYSTLKLVWKVGGWYFWSH